MSNNNDAELKIGADESGVKVGMENSVAAVQQSVARMEAIFTRFAQTIEGQATATAAASNQMAVAAEASSAKMAASFNGLHASVEGVKTNIVGIGQAFAKVQATLIGFYGLLAGDRLFGRIVDETVSWTKEAVALSHALGITTEQASVLNVALGDIHQSGEAMTSAAAKLTKTLNTQESAFADLGVATRDQAGHLRSTLEIMADAHAKLLEFREGTDRNIEGTKIYGKAWSEVAGILKLTPQVLADAAIKARELHLIVGPDGEARTKAYRAALNDVQDVGKSLTIQFGEKLLPAFTRVGAFLGQEGPKMAETFKSILQSVGFVAGSVWLTLKDMGDAIGALAAQAAAVLSGDFAQAKLIGKMRDEQYAKNKAEYEKWKKEAFADPPPPPAGAPAPDKRSKGGKDDRADKVDLLGIWKEELLQRIQLEEGFFRDSTALEAEFWAGKLALTKEGSKERRAVEKEIFEAYKKLAHDNLAVEIDDLKLRASLERAGGVERIQIAGQIAARLAEVYGDDSQQYRAALREMAQAAREHAAQQLQIEQAQAERRQAASLGEIEAEQQRLEARRALGEISAEQELAALAKLEERKYRIELDYARQRAELVQDDPVAYEQALAKIEAIERAHAQRIGKINTDLAKEQNALWASLGDRAASLWDKGLQAMMNGTLTWKNAFKAVLTELTSWFVVDVVGKKVKAWLAGEVAKTTATQTGSAARLAAEQTASSAGLLAQMGSVIKSIMNFAAEAFAGVFAALSGIPIVGPAMAAAAAPAAMATVVGVAGMVSAAQGYDIPASVNPIVQTHAREMILPERYADVIRAMAEQGGGVAGAASSAAIHIHAGSDKDTLRVADLKKILRQMGRDFVDVRL